MISSMDKAIKNGLKGPNLTGNSKKGKKTVKENFNGLTKAAMKEIL